MHRAKRNALHRLNVIGKLMSRCRQDGRSCQNASQGIQDNIGTLNDRAQRISKLVGNHILAINKGGWRHIR